MSWSGSRLCSDPLMRSLVCCSPPHPPPASLDDVMPLTGQRPDWVGRQDLPGRRLFTSRNSSLGARPLSFLPSFSCFSLLAASALLFAPVPAILLTLLLYLFYPHVPVLPFSSMLFLHLYCILPFLTSVPLQLTFPGGVQESFSQ